MTPFAGVLYCRSNLVFRVFPEIITVAIIRAIGTGCQMKFAKAKIWSLFDARDNGRTLVISTALYM